MNYSIAKITLAMNGLFDGTAKENRVFKNSNGCAVREIVDRNFMIRVTDHGDTVGMSISDNGGSNSLAVCASDKRENWRKNFALIIAALTEEV